MEHLHAPPDADPAIQRSWRRSALLGLSPRRPPGTRSDNAAPRPQVWLGSIQPLIDHLRDHLARSASALVLADGSGRLIHLGGDAEFLGRIAPLGFSHGESWSEAQRGTNPIGIALAEQRPVLVRREDHFLECNRVVNGIAVPLVLQDAQVPGALALISTAAVNPGHAIALLQTTAAAIENRLIATRNDASLVLHFAPKAELVHSPLEGVAAFDSDGHLLACNALGHEYLAGCDIRRLGLRGWTGMTPMEFRRHGRQFGAGPFAIGLPRLRRVMASWHTTVSPQLVRPVGPGESEPRDLQALDQGDPRIAEAVRRATRIAGHQIPLLIHGETGTGKEVFAQAFHHSSPRRSGPFVAINCAAIPAALIEAELFGYAPGAYTGARREGARGRVREAHGGTLFLDEIGDMPLQLQAVLLRVLETRRVPPLGGGPEEEVDIAVICASHRSLRELAEHGQFRTDLLFRLSGMTVTLPPLRERSDLHVLAREILAEEATSRRIRVGSETLTLLRSLPWPGNIRQLRNVLKVAVAQMDDEENVLSIHHLPMDLLEEISRPGAPLSTACSLKASETKLVHEAVARHGGNISAAARELGITRTTLYRKLRQP